MGPLFLEELTFDLILAQGKGGASETKSELSKFYGPRLSTLLLGGIFI